MENKENCNAFINRESKSMTLRFALKPQGRTEEVLKEKWGLLQDDERYKAYPIVKELLDREHRQLINKVLEKLEQEPEINWDDIGRMLSEVNNGKENRKELQSEQQRIRTFLAEKLKNNDIWKRLQGKEPFGKKGYLSALELSEEERAAVRIFDGFSVYFSNYYKNREAVYSDEDVVTGVAHRIVNENFVRFSHNMNIILQLQKETELMQEISKASQKAGITICLERLSGYNGMNTVLSQKGIDRYNAIIGFLNLHINLYIQQHAKAITEDSILKSRRKCKLVVLFKQILSTADKKVIIEEFDNDRQLIEQVDIFSKELQREVEGSLLNIIEELFGGSRTFNEKNVYLNMNALSDISILLGGRWDMLEKALRSYYREKLQGSIKENKLDEEVEKLLRKKGVTIYDIRQSVGCCNQLRSMENGAEEHDCYNLDKIYERILQCADQTKEYYEKLKIFFTRIDEKKNLKEMDIKPLKEYLDVWLELNRYLKNFTFADIESVFRDSEFYLTLDEILYRMREFVSVYNKVRNYVTKKPYSVKKQLLKFGNPTIADGWSVDKERAYGTVLLRKDGKYYLGIFNPDDKPEIIADENLSTAFYEKMVYNLFKDVSKMIPKCSTQLKAVKVHFEESNEAYILNDPKTFVKPLTITREIYELNNILHNGKKKWQKDYLKTTGDETGYREAVRAWNAFCMDFVKAYRNTSIYDYSSIQPLEEYDSVSDLYHDLDKLLYRITFTKVTEQQIEKLVDEGQLFLFQIYNKDFSENKKQNKGAHKNLHTLYWEALFSEENARDGIIKLNGGAELFLRPASIKNKTVHKAGSVLLNKNTSTGRTIPEAAYVELLHYFNSGEKTVLSAEAQTYKDLVVKSVRTYDIIKDRRFTQDQYMLHVPITLNYRADVRKTSLNEEVLKSIQTAQDMHIIGLDRGERNLITYTVVDLNGKIKKQGSFNTICTGQDIDGKKRKVDYHEKIDQKRKDRDRQKKDWKAIENIKDLKAGYISQVVHEICMLMVEYNAIIVMENLNYGFKRGRFKVEKQVYQKFETALLQKLSYMVITKDEDKMCEPGGVMRGYQLAAIPQSVQAVGNQIGAVFYVPAAYTSKIDPTTGFADVFNYTSLTDRESRKLFFSKFDDIAYDPGKGAFAFSFTLQEGRFAVYQTMFKKSWTVYSAVGERGSKHVYNKEKKKCDIENSTEKLKALFKKYDIAYENGLLKEQIMEVPASTEFAPFWRELDYIFRLIMRLRDSASADAEHVVDRIVSPVEAADGRMFVTPDEPGDSNQYDELPMDADTNGAYHIAMKGLYLVKEKIMKTEQTDRLPKDFYRITNAEWFRFMQERTWMN